MNNKGMSMVEVLVGFVVLSVIIAGVFHMIKFGSNMLYEGMDVKQSQQNFEKEIYKTSRDDGLIDVKEIKALGAGDFVLRPSSNPAGNASQVSKESSINMFAPVDESVAPEDVDELKINLNSYCYKENDISIKVYGFEK